MGDSLTHRSYVSVSCRLGFGWRWQIMEVSHICVWLDMACYSFITDPLIPQHHSQIQVSQVRGTIYSGGRGAPIPGLCIPVSSALLGT